MNHEFVAPMQLFEREHGWHYVAEISVSFETRTRA